jgi:PKD repeat protein
MILLRTFFSFFIVIIIGINTSVLFEKNFGKAQSLSTSDIDGLYYLRGIDPINKNDVGSLLRNASSESEITQCSVFIVFHFTEPGNYTDLYRITNIYYHCWLRARASPYLPQPSPIHNLGYSTFKNHNGLMNESLQITTMNNVSFVDDYALVHAQLNTNPNIAVFNGCAIFNFTVKDNTGGGFPELLTSPHQSSFIMVNVEDTATLHSLDRDNDGITDYDELYLYYTNPFDQDTDHDGATDFEEVNGASHGSWNSDPNSYLSTTNYRRLSIDAGGPYIGAINENLHFEGALQGTYPPFTYLWDFGDNFTSTEPDPFHAYSSSGRYTVTLTVADAWGYTKNGTSNASIQILTTDAHGPYYREIHHPIVFNGSAIFGVLPYTWQWDFGDGNGSTEQNPVHAYERIGNYPITLIVQDGEGNKSTDTTVAIILFEHLTADAHGPYQGTIDTPIQFIGSTQGGKPPFTYQWDFGDENTSAEQNPIHTYSRVGTYSIIFTVTQNGGPERYSVSNTTTVTIMGKPEIFIKKISGGSRVISAIIENTGNDNATNVKWNMTIAGGLFVKPRRVNGTIDVISARNQAVIKMNVFGLGLGLFKPLLVIVVDATCAEGSSAERNVTGKIFFFLIKVL